MLTRLKALFSPSGGDPALHPFRHGLWFAFFNALTWQVGIGTPMILFAEELGADSFEVGLAYSFVFVLTPIQVLSTALLPRYGFKKVMLSGWGARSFFLAVPVALAALAPATPAPWMVTALVTSVFFFCLCRSVGAAAIIPWLYVILPEKSRGRYFASDQFLSGVAGVGTLFACSALFALLPIYTALLIQYIIAMAGSYASYRALTKLEDAPKPTALSLLEVVRRTPPACFGRGVFSRYLWMTVAFAVLTSPVPPFSTYYLKTSAGLSPARIMLFSAIQYVGVIVGALFMRSQIDRRGARRYFLLSLLLYGAVAAYWWAFLRSGARGVGLLPIVYFALGGAAAFWASANLNYLPKIVPPEDRSLLVSIQGAVTAFLGGLSALVWGVFLKGGGGDPTSMNAGVFELLFIGLFGAALLLALAVARLPEGDVAAEPLFVGGAILRPFRDALTFLINFVETPPRPKSPEPPPPRERDRG